MIKQAYEQGVMAALRDAGLTKEANVELLARAGLLGASGGSTLGLISPEAVGHDPLWEAPHVRLGKGMGLGAMYGAGAGVAAGGTALGGKKLLELLKIIK